MKNAVQQKIEDGIADDPHTAPGVAAIRLLIYDKKRHCVITVLTMEMLSASEQAEVMRAGCSA